MINCLAHNCSFCSRAPSQLCTIFAAGNAQEFPAVVVQDSRSITPIVCLLKNTKGEDSEENWKIQKDRSQDTIVNQTFESLRKREIRKEHEPNNHGSIVPTASAENSRGHAQSPSTFRGWAGKSRAETLVLLVCQDTLQGHLNAHGVTLWWPYLHSTPHADLVPVAPV